MSTNDDLSDDAIVEAFREQLARLKKRVGDIRADVNHIAGVRPEVGDGLKQMVDDFDPRAEAGAESP